VPRLGAGRTHVDFAVTLSIDNVSETVSQDKPQ
jgi:hypothetical protein